MSPAPDTDGRRQRGDRTRRAVSAAAAALASVDGLDGVTLSQVAGELGVSKSSIQAAFASKEQLQLAAVEAATEVFLREVVTPAMAQAEGLPRLRGLAESWLAYVEHRVFPGGCFMVATLSEFDSRPGPVRDALRRARRGWLKLLERNAQVAQEAGHIADQPAAPLVAFEIDALLSMANVQRNITDDIAALDDARRLIDLRLGRPAKRRGA
ncbi:MAG: TetR family transcriptional regulator [Actinobacteria bacterium]|nr:TetR family transcriptional regulator [Actinomycetota bacterium]MBV9662669.1 TetR family transcriptional regulator [Actinomycetota bacterium]MBV9934753.1 TetR family transcriptional regulator [Actinomycetota bacterium]